MEGVNLLGRDDELAAIDEFVRVDGPLPAALVLEGEAGIGKTTLWRHTLVAAEESGLRTLSCSPVQSEAGLSFGGLADLLDELFEDAVPALPAPQARALAVALRRADPGANPLDQFAVRVGFLNALRTLSSETPVVVAIDDVQWLDRPTELALAFVLRRLRRERLVFLLSRRLGRGGWSALRARSRVP